MSKTTAAAHTAGPWTVEKSNQRQSPNLWIIAPGNAGICKIEPCDYDDGKGERLTAEDFANARLIAAAPELLEALTDITAFLRGVNTLSTRGAEIEISRLCRNSEAALTKAKGGASHG